MSNIEKERWYATIVGFLGKEGFKWWNNLPISKQEENKKESRQIFKSIGNTLEVSTSYWNHIDEMYSDTTEEEHKSTDQLDQCIKDLVERCQYQTKAKKMVHAEQSCFFMQQNIFRSQKMGQIEEEEIGCHISSPPPTYQGAQDDSKRLPTDTQVQWWNCNSNTHRWDQDIQPQER